MRLFVLFALCVCVLGEERPSRLVTTAQGPVRGYKDPDYDVFVFYSIPYATAPTGRIKFRPPGPPPVWQEPFEAVDKQIICPQPEFFLLQNDMKTIQEDCLIANIYVPNTEADMLPVAIYVHGGAYLIGYGELADPRKLLKTKKMIIVTFNYRLAGNGFLCLGTEDIPGNAGMKDQVAMLRWVKNNIASFGGNPNDVTLVGSSAGSSSVDLMILSKMTEGLFNKVIPESGANTALFSMQTDPIQVAKEYAMLLNYTNDSDDIHDLEEFFKSISIERLNSIMTVNRTDGTVLIGPCVERDTGDEMFLHDAPVNILKSGDYQKVPMLYGFTNMEGILRLAFVYGDAKSDLEHMNRNFSDYVPSDLYFATAEERLEVANKIKSFYFGDTTTTIDENHILDYVNFFTDIYFAYSTLRSVKLHLEAGHNQIYLYEYSYTDEHTPPLPFSDIQGAEHCAQSTAVWDFKAGFRKDPNPTKTFKKLQKKLRKIWINFIITGKPIPENSKLPKWPPVRNKWSPHMSFSKTIELRGSLLKKRALFWEGIYAKHYRTPLPPPPPAEKQIGI